MVLFCAFHTKDGQNTRRRPPTTLAEVFRRKKIHGRP